MKMVIRNLLVDITGVIYESGFNRPINGSIQAVEKLAKSSINYAFLTNETEKTRKLLVEKLNGIGFSLSEQQIISPGIVCKKYLEANQLRPHLLISPELMGDFDGIDRTDPNCVVIGDAANEFSYPNLNEAFNLLMRLERPILITMGANKFYQSYGELFLDCGAYAALLEYATGTKPKVIGKPAPEYFNLAMESFNMKPEETLMIGDDIEYDVGGAQNAGLRGGVLVRSGKYRRERDENHKTVKPFLIVDNLLELVGKLINKEIE